MKRSISLLLLVCVAVACKDDGPTVPALDPQFGKPNCDIDPSHPTCNGGDGGGDIGAYIATPLGQPKVLSEAFDLSDPSDGGALLITGLSHQWTGDPAATVWTLTATGTTDIELPRRSGRPYSSAQGTNDNGSIIVGYDGSRLAGAGTIIIVEEEPLMWTAAAGFAVQELDFYWNGQLPQVSYDRGFARDANNSELIVGASCNYMYYCHATVWNADGSVRTRLGSWHEQGSSQAYSINNAGYVVGYGTAANRGEPFHAMLWQPSVDPDARWTSCDLHVQSGWGGASESIAVGISELASDEVLVVGEGPAGNVIWRGNPANCVSFSVAYEVSDAELHDVSLNGEAVGKTASGKVKPVHWDAQTGSTVLDDVVGVASKINRAGQIVGRAQVKGTERAILWVPRSSQ